MRCLFEGRVCVAALFIRARRDQSRVVLGVSSRLPNATFGYSRCPMNVSIMAKIRFGVSTLQGCEVNAPHPTYQELRDGEHLFTLSTSKLTTSSQWEG